MKPGIKTTEFWTTVLVHLITVATVILSATGSSFDTSKLNALVPVAAMIASGIVQSFYSASRGRVKAAPTPNTATVTDVAAPVAAATTDLVPPFNG